MWVNTDSRTRLRVRAIGSADRCDRLVAEEQSSDGSWIIICDNPCPKVYGTGVSRKLPAEFSTIWEAHTWEEIPDAEQK